MYIMWFFTMLTITIRKNGWEVEGHADYAPHGSDIVCSAISTLAQIISMEIQSYADCDYIARSGFLHFHIKDNLERTEVRALTRTFKNGVTLISKDFPEYVKILPL